MIRKTTDKSRGIRLGNFVQIRTIVDEELEQVWSGKKTAKEGLDAAVQRGNEQLERFEKHAEPTGAETWPARTSPWPSKSASVFKSWWLPWVLIAPQMAIILVFFFWPAGQALYQSVLQQDAFGTSTEFVGLRELQAPVRRRRPTSRRSGRRRCSRCWSPCSAWPSRCCSR